jgi:cell division control protein 6
VHGSQTVEIQDVEMAYDKSKYVHLLHRLQELSDPETAFMGVIAKHDGGQDFNIYQAFSDRTEIDYTEYAEIINELDQLRIIDAVHSEVENPSRPRESSLKYNIDAVLERL